MATPSALDAPQGSLDKWTRWALKTRHYGALELGKLLNRTRGTPDWSFLGEKCANLLAQFLPYELLIEMEGKWPDRYTQLWQGSRGQLSEQEVVDAYLRLVKELYVRDESAQLLQAVAAVRLGDAGALPQEQPQDLYRRLRNDYALLLAMGQCTLQQVCHMLIDSICRPDPRSPMSLKADEFFDSCRQKVLGNMKQWIREGNMKTPQHPAHALEKIMAACQGVYDDLISSTVPGVGMFSSQPPRSAKPPPVHRSAPQQATQYQPQPTDAGGRPMFWCRVHGHNFSHDDSMCRAQAAASHAGAGPAGASQAAASVASQGSTAVSMAADPRVEEVQEQLSRLMAMPAAQQHHPMPAQGPVSYWPPYAASGYMTCTTGAPPSCTSQPPAQVPPASQDGDGYDEA